MGDAPELVIPVRIDPEAALSSLKQVGAQGGRTGKEVKAGFDEAGTGAVNLTDSVGNLIKAQIGVGAVKQAVGAMTAEFKRAADYTQSLVENFVGIQKTMQSVAAISGKQNTNAFVVKEAQAAAAANLTPENFTAFRDAFLSKASNYVGNKPGAKLSEADSDSFQASMAEYAALHGVSTGEMAEFAGGLLAQEKGPTTAEKMKAKAGRVFSTLEASSAKVSHLLPGMTRVMAQGFSAEEAAPTLAMMPEIAPEEESTHLLRVIGEVRKLNLEGKGGAYGMTKGMTPQQQLEQLVGNLSERTSKGEDLDKLIQGVTHEDIAGNTLRGLVRQGPKGFDQWKGILKSTPDNAVDADIALGRQSDAGKIMHGEAQVALAQTEQASLKAAVEPERKLAEAEYIRSGKREEYHPLERFGRGFIGATITGVGADEQEINQIMLANVRQRAIAAGVKDPDLEYASRTGNDALLTQQVDLNKEVVRLLGLILEKENPKPATPVSAPVRSLVAPPPDPPRRM
jgi:hypothetical protein